jgi:hypothetical protein
MSKSGDNTGLILLAVGGAAAYYAYTQGWLCSLFGLGCPATATAATAATAATVPIVTSSASPPVVSTPAPPPAAASVPVASLQSQLQAVASQPGNVALSTSGGATYSGWQWDAIAKSALGSSYVPLSSLPAIQGGTQYTIQQYLSAYPGGGLGRVVVVFPRRQMRMVLPSNYHMRSL